MAPRIEIGAVDRTGLVLAESLAILLRADQRNTCTLKLQSTAATFLPRVGQGIRALEDVTDYAVGTGDGAEDTFYLIAPILAASETIYLDAVPTAAYTLNDATGELVLDVAPGVGVLITADYTMVLFGGIIRTAPQRRVGKRAPSDASIVEVSIYSDGYQAIPARRTIITDWAVTDAGDIVEYLVDTFLTHEGVGKGTIDTGVEVATYRRPVVSIKEVLDDMAILSGFKWWIDDTKALHFTQEAPLVDAAHAISEGGPFVDFGEVRLEEQLDQYANKVFIAGADEYAFTKEDAAEIAARVVIEGGTGVYGFVLSAPEIDNDIDAEVIADNLLKQRGRVPVVLTFRSYHTDWRAGTRLLANLPTFGMALDRYFLITEVQITDLGGDTMRSKVTAVRRQSNADGV